MGKVLSQSQLIKACRAEGNDIARAILWMRAKAQASNWHPMTDEARSPHRYMAELLEGAAHFILHDEQMSTIERNVRELWGIPKDPSIPWNFDENMDTLYQEMLNSLPYPLVAFAIPTKVGRNVVVLKKVTNPLGIGTDFAAITLHLVQSQFTGVSRDNWKLIPVTCNYTLPKGNVIYLPCEGAIPKTEENDEIRTHLFAFLGTCVAIIQFMNQERTKIITTGKTLPAAANKVRIAQGKFPLFEIKRLELDPTKPILSQPEPQGGTHASPREHSRRGHYRRYRNGKVTWVNPMWVNKGAQHGRINKIYELRG